MPGSGATATGGPASAWLRLLVRGRAPSRSRSGQVNFKPGQIVSTGQQEFLESGCCVELTAPRPIHRMPAPPGITIATRRLTSGPRRRVACASEWGLPPPARSCTWPTERRTLRRQAPPPRCSRSVPLADCAFGTTRSASAGSAAAVRHQTPRRAARTHASTSPQGPMPIDPSGMRRSLPARRRPLLGLPRPKAAPAPAAPACSTERGTGRRDR